MALINFVAEFNSVIRYCYENGLPVRERMLLIALFYAANSRAVPIPAEYENASNQYDWPDDFFTVSNAELNLYAGLEKRAILEARNSLCQRGIIEVRAGQRRTKVPEYRISYFSIGYNNVPNNTPKTPQNSPNNTPKTPQRHPKDTPKAPQKHPLIYKLKQTKETNTDDDEDNEGDALSLCADAGANEISEREARTNLFFQALIGRWPTPAETNSICTASSLLEMDSMIGTAIEYAASAGAKSPAKYVATLLRDWWERGIRDRDTLRRVEEIERMTKDGEYTSDEGYRLIKEATGRT